MKLIDILVEELPKRGGWPKGAARLAQDPDGDIQMLSNRHAYLLRGVGWTGDGREDFREEYAARALKPLASDHTTAIITREQYEAALAAKNDGWIDWHGGECPVPEGALVDVRYRNSEKFPDTFGTITLEVGGYGATGRHWNHDGYPNDIIAYRLHQPQEAEQAEADDEADLNECIGQDAAPVWNGEGLPPVGMEIEYSFAKVNYRTDFSRGKVLAYGMQNVFMEHWASKNEFIQPLDKIEFRPIRSEAERKRDEAVQALCYAGRGNGKVDEKASYGSCWFDVYDAIAAGKIPGVKLDN